MAWGRSSLWVGILGTTLGTTWWLPRTTMPTTTIQSPGARWEVCFTPAQPCLPLIVRKIDAAAQCIYLQAYGLTSRAIAQALIRAHQRGVRVYVLVDKSQKNDTRSQFAKLVSAGISLRIDTKPAIAHNKVMIIDQKITLTGSYNWTEGAEHRNAENILVVDNVPLAKAYLDNFKSRWKVSVTVSSFSKDVYEGSTRHRKAKKHTPASLLAFVEDAA